MGLPAWMICSDNPGSDYVHVPVGNVTRLWVRRDQLERALEDYFGRPYRSIVNVEKEGHDG